MGRIISPAYSSTRTKDNSASKPLTIKQLREYPPEASKLQIPEATSEGRVKVAVGRDGPFELHYKMYGHGPIRIIWIGGHAAGLEDWYPIVPEFGIRNAEKYTSLLFENRGIGQSGGPLGWWSIKDLALDARDLLTQLQWTGDNSVHIVGHSMGGMIAQHLAIINPKSTASLTLLSTTSNYYRDLSFYNIVKSALSAPLLLTADSRLDATKAQAFGRGWLAAPDPTGTFPTNGDAWAARFLQYPNYIKGAILTLPSIGRHRVDPMALKAVAERLGTGKIAIAHGWNDQIIPVHAAERMWEDFGGKGAGVKILVWDDVGHLPHVERLKEVSDLIESVVNGTMSVN